jgi:hypothetical protein
MNLWRGWGIQPVKGRWPLMRKHIEEILSGGEQAMVDYALGWTAWGFQNPGDLTESALTFTHPSQSAIIFSRSPGCFSNSSAIVEMVLASK